MKAITLKLAILFIVMVSLNVELNAQQWQFAIGYGSGQTAFVAGVASDNNGNLYAIGNYQGLVNFGSGLSLNSPTPAAYIVSYDANGNAMWVQSIDGTATGSGIALDASGKNIYVTGTFTGTVKFGGNAFHITPPLNGRNTYVAKYNSKGNFLWADKILCSQPLTSYFGVNSNGIAVDGGGYCYLTGYFYNCTALFPNYTNLQPGNINTIYIAQWDPNGKFTWEKGPSGTTLTSYGSAIAVDKTGNSYVAGGVVGGNGSFGGLALANYNNAEETGFVVSCDFYGNIIYLETIVAANSNSGSAPTSIAADNYGNCYVAGNFSDSITIGNFVLKSSYNPNYYNNIFIAKIQNTSPNGKTLWAIQEGGQNPLSTDYTNATSICYNDNLKSLFIGGYFEGHALFNNGLVSLKCPYTEVDSYLAEFDSKGGAYLDIKQITGNGSPVISNICSDPGIQNPNFIYAIGNYSNVQSEPINFYNDLKFNSGITLSPLNIQNCFIGKYIFSGNFFKLANPLNEPGSNDTKGEAISSLEIYPNPIRTSASILYSLTQDSNIELSIWDLLGNRIAILKNERVLAGDYSEQIDASILATGVYIIKLNIQGRAIAQKVYVIH